MFATTKMSNKQKDELIETLRHSLLLVNHSAQVSRYMFNANDNVILPPPCVGFGSIKGFNQYSKEILFRERHSGIESVAVLNNGFLTPSYSSKSSYHNLEGFLADGLLLVSDIQSNISILDRTKETDNLTGLNTKLRFPKVYQNGQAIVGIKDFKQGTGGKLTCIGIDGNLIFEMDEFHNVFDVAASYESADLAFETSTIRNWINQIYYLKSSSTDPVCVTSSGCLHDISSSGRYILFTEHPGNTEIPYLSVLDTSTGRRNTTGIHGTASVFSPDEKFIASVYDFEKGDIRETKRRLGIYSFNDVLTKRTPEPISHTILFSERSFPHPNWSPRYLKD
jgi:hypothetical protein